MNQYIPYVFLFVMAVIFIRLLTQYSSRHNRKWQACAQKYRLSFKVGKEEKGQASLRAYRLKGYYRTCLISIFSSPTIGQSETSVTISYPKNLLDNLAPYPEGILSRIGKGLSRQTDSRGGQKPFFLTLPSKGVGDVQKELNPQIREQMIQLMIICSGKGKRIDVTDAYLLYRQQGFIPNPEQLFPMIDEMLATINVMEENVGEILR